jgi:hypothetical protein
VAFVHGRHTKITVGGSDLSAYTNTSELNRTKDTHDVTTYGADAHAFSSGLGNSTGSLGGIYDNTTAGPRDVLQPLIDAGAPVAVVRQPEGAGTGLPQDTVTAILNQYVETNPVAEMVAWTCQFQGTGSVVSTNQT